MSSQFSTVPTSSPAPNQPIRRQPRGSINRRACQKCRHLKIKCDGDAEHNVACSNCDRGTCVYDKSPRKNRQVERLNNRIEILENTLTETQGNLELIQQDFTKKTDEYNTSADVLKLEKQILDLLIECFERFIEHPMLMRQLRQVISESRCCSILLPVIQTLLVRLSQPQSEETVNNIITMLKSITESSLASYSPGESFNPPTTYPNYIEDIFAQMNVGSISEQTLSVNESVSAGMSNLALHSHSPGSDVGSDMSNLSVHDYKIALTSPILSSNIESIDETNYYHHVFVEPTFFYDSSYGSNSSNNGQ